MASANKTENYKLNQWVGTDPVLMEDFNADNAKIDAALSALKSGALKMVLGSYVGNGEHGPASPTSLSFDFEPDVVILKRPYDIELNPCGLGAVLIRPMNSVGMELYTIGDSATSRRLNLAWGEKSVSWWTDVYAGDDSHAANWQLNSDGGRYYYAAFGF